MNFIPVRKIKFNRKGKKFVKHLLKFMFMINKSDKKDKKTELKYGESMCPKCGTIFSIKPLLEDVDFMQTIKEENYFLGVKHGIDSVKFDNEG